MQIALVVLAVAAFAAASPAQNYYKPAAYLAKPAYSSYKDSYDYAPAYYSFDYSVKDDYTYVDMGHKESRNGDNTKGSYTVVLPDGRRQTVNYHVDGYSGYVADVQYDGYAKAYDYKPAAYPAKPAYKPVY